MSHNDLQFLLDRLNQMTVGFTPIFREFSVQTNNYPPHNIITINDTEFDIELAVAGFKKTEITIEENQGLLTVRGTKATKPTDEGYQFRGIAARDFAKQFRIAEYFEIKAAKMEDGILTISFVKNVPEAAKPKLIAIE